ncbi:unnamed protein product [Rotaria socialis]|uniref:Lebercilin domain-containing protein n=1 Tax=Rotaria socialis TaxID=392032 RepID=A0A819ZXD5_9BILA|nr:unnamed protein product [Rotaria socialis]CAF4169656.1 unnamed protein product [Rotaria socialis]
MSSRKSSVDSMGEFFGASKTDNNNIEKKPEEDDISPSAAITTLIKTQPVIHHPQTASDTSNKNSQHTPSKTNLSKTPASLSPKAKPIDTPQSKLYESDFDDDKRQTNTERSLENKKKFSSGRLLPPPKQHSYESPRRATDSKLIASYTTTNHINKNPNNYMRRKERFLPNIRPPKHRKGILKRPTKDHRSEFEKRITSAKRHQMNQLNSCIAEVRRQLEEERVENRTLRLIKHREEKELTKFAGQEEDLLLVLRNFSNEIEQVKEQITHEREANVKLEKQMAHRDRILNDQKRRMRVYIKLIDEQDLDDAEELRERLKKTNKKLKQNQEQLSNQEKQIENLEKNYRHEIHRELLKRRDLKREIDDQSNKYTNLFLKFEDKARQVDTMHIYIQRGGRRPSHSSTNLLKSLSLQSLEDESPRFREKILEYDKKRREEEKLKLKSKPLPLPNHNNNSPPKRERKKYVPNFEQKLPIKKPTAVVLSHVKHDEKPSTIENEPLPANGKPPARRLSTPKSTDEDRSDLDQETVSDFIHLKPPSAPSKTIQRREQHLSQAPIHKRSLTPTSPPFDPKFATLGTNGTTTRLNPFRNMEPLAPIKPSVKHELDDKWNSTFDADDKEDQRSTLTSDQSTKKTPPSSQPSSLIMFDPATSSTNGHQKKPPARVTATTNMFDFDQSVNNLHDGVPISTPTKTKRSVDPFDSLFGNKTNKPTTHMNGRDDTFTTATTDKSDPLDFNFDKTAPATTTVSTAIKTTSKQYPLKNDKLQRPKIITTAPKPIPNRTVVEEIEEFIL